jgi:hypothetical protein
LTIGFGTGAGAFLLGNKGYDEGTFAVTAKILKFDKTIKPSRPLKSAGTDLWNKVNDEYRIEDSAGTEMLLQACQALDLAEQCAAEIKKHGVLIRTKTGFRDNPVCKIELSARAFVVRTLGRLGLDAEPLRAIGRPPGSFNYGAGNANS